MNEIPQMASVVLARNDQLLLGYKKSGLGTGKYVCVGGHIDEGETPLQAAIRETQEEIFITLDPAHVRLVAIMDFIFPAKNHWQATCHYFYCDNWEGTPKESDEIAPRFYLKDNTPYDQMWQDAQHWLPQILTGSPRILCSFTYADDNETIAEYTLSPLNSVSSTHDPS